jgi:tRNA A-37 threonylcarbamoyl transferase component Bud32
MNMRCSTALLESALAGTLTAGDETALHRHLETCEACSSALERMAGGAAWCQEAASLLTGDELDADMPIFDEWSEVDFMVEHLEPANEPNVLGRLGGYDVLEVIGRGGMSVVLKGFDRELKRYVAIKVLAPHLAQSAVAKKRFAREAQAAAAVVHPHVLAIHQVQPHARLPFLVMPLVAGESLAERLASRGALELREVLRIGMQAAAGLAAAHQQGLVHRDVKPANILLEKDVERAVLMDFGLARAADDVSLTRYGIIAGTPEYMSPEQARGEAVDGRSDLFSLGCVLYEMASGVSPFRADTSLATLRRLIDERPKALASLNPELPPWFVAIVERLLEKDPARRFSSAKEVADLLEGCLAHLQHPGNVPLPASAQHEKAARAASAPGRRWSRIRRIATAITIVTIASGAIAAFMMATAEPSDISGAWTGDDWANIVLQRTGPAEYSGTYSDALGKEPGKIALKWSRIERRYNGTWSDGQMRFGKISVRQVSDEIRGAWTTSRDSEINPATPELADLLWVRRKADSQGKHAPDQSRGVGEKESQSYWTFGPTLRRTLYCPSESSNLLGKTKSFSGNEAICLADGKVFNLPRPTASEKELPAEKLEKWYSETNVNLVIDYRKETDQWEMKLRNVKFAELPEIPTESPKDWKTLSANELQARFARLEWKKTADDTMNRKYFGFHSLPLIQGMNPPMTFAFETSDGLRGILQFYAWNVTPTHYRNALIRYKLLQPSGGSANLEGDGGVQSSAAPSTRTALARGIGRDEVAVFGDLNGWIPLSFLTHKSVQEDLKMTDLQVKQADAAFQKHSEAVQHLRDLPGQPARTQKRLELSKEAYKAAKDILNVDQQKRLRQISLQQQGVRALNNSTREGTQISEELGLSDDQQGQIRGLIENARKRSRDYSKEADRKIVEEIEKKLNAMVLAVLTSEQKTKWKEMTGKPFSGGQFIGHWRPGE